MDHESCNLGFPQEHYGVVMGQPVFQPICPVSGGFVPIQIIDEEVQHAISQSCSNPIHLSSENGDWISVRSMPDHAHSDMNYFIHHPSGTMFEDIPQAGEFEPQVMVCRLECTVPSNRGEGMVLEEGEFYKHPDVMDYEDHSKEVSVHVITLGESEMTECDIGTATEMGRLTTQTRQTEGDQGSETSEDVSEPLEFQPTCKSCPSAPVNSEVEIDDEVVEGENIHGVRGQIETDDWGSVCPTLVANENIKSETTKDDSKSETTIFVCGPPKIISSEEECGESHPETKENPNEPVKVMEVKIEILKYCDMDRQHSTTTKVTEGQEEPKSGIEDEEASEGEPEGQQESSADEYIEDQHEPNDEGDVETPICEIDEDQQEYNEEEEEYLKEEETPEYEPAASACEADNQERPDDQYESNDEDEYLVEEEQEEQDPEDESEYLSRSESETDDNGEQPAPKEEEQVVTESMENTPENPENDSIDEGSKYVSLDSWLKEFTILSTSDNVEADPKSVRKFRSSPSIKSMSQPTSYSIKTFENLSELMRNEPDFRMINIDEKAESSKYIVEEFRNGEWKTVKQTTRDLMITAPRCRLKKDSKPQKMNTLDEVESMKEEEPWDSKAEIKDQFLANQEPVADDAIVDDPAEPIDYDPRIAYTTPISQTPNCSIDKKHKEENPVAPEPMSSVDKIEPSSTTKCMKESPEQKAFKLEFTVCNCVPVKSTSKPEAPQKCEGSEEETIPEEDPSRPDPTREELLTELKKSYDLFRGFLK